MHKIMWISLFLFITFCKHSPSALKEDSPLSIPQSPLYELNLAKASINKYFGKESVALFGPSMEPFEVTDAVVDHVVMRMLQHRNPYLREYYRRLFSAGMSEDLEKAVIQEFIAGTNFIEASFARLKKIPLPISKSSH